jgi:nitrite reductase/ring-hydroxylating ferredoxin subunit
MATATFEVAEIDQAAARVDRAIAQARELSEPSRAKALEVKDAIEEFHKDGLVRIVRHLRADPRGKELLMELAADPLVYMLFAMHGIVRTDAPPEPVKGGGGFVPLGNLMMAPGWKNGPAVAELSEGKPFRLDIGETSILVLMMNGAVNAFRNECAHQGLPLDGGMVDRDACTITCPWHGFRYDATSGECLTAPQAQLERVEAKIENGRVQVRPA